MFGDLFAPSLEYPVLEGLIMTKNRGSVSKSMNYNSTLTKSVRIRGVTVNPRPFLLPVVVG